MPMPQPIEDDLFRESTMSFGQHLEELRGCLFKSVFALGVGFLVGMMIGGYVVDFIQRPLSKALAEYHQTESIKRANSELEKLEKAGDTLPWTAEQAERRILKDEMLLDEVFIDPGEMFQQLKAAYPGQFADIELPKPAPTAEQNAEQASDDDSAKLVRLFLWHRSADDPRIRIKSFNAQEGFVVYLKASLLVGVLLASPYVFFQIWHFVAAGLYPHERQYVHSYLPFSLGLFLFGAALAFFFVFEPVLNFLLGFNRYLGIDPEPRINEWLGFALLLPVGFGIGFQLPLVMFFLERIGVFSVQSYLRQWRVAVLVIFVIAAFLCPPDPYSMLFLACPLTLLYFGGILMCMLMPRRASPFD